MYTALLAEDELLVRIGIASCVPWGDMGIRLVGETDDGREAWELYRKLKPDLVITDIRMPGLSGMELIANIRKQDTACGVIVITNVESDEIRRQAEELGVSEFLLKAAMRKDDISAAVQRVCATLKGKTEVSRQEEPAEARWHRMLFEETQSDWTPFVVEGVLGIRIFPGDRLSHQMQLSLTNLILHRLECPQEYVAVSKGSCLMLLWKKNPLQFASAQWLRELARYVQEQFQLKVGLVLLREKPGSQLRRLVQLQITLLHEAAYFDDPLLEIGADGTYRHEGLSCLKQDMLRNLPLYMENAAFHRCRQALESYPGGLEAGFEALKIRNMELLCQLGSTGNFSGLSQMTAWLCDSIQRQWLSLVSQLRPELRQALDYIRDHLQEELNIEQVSNVAGFQSTYFSRLFKAELACSFSDYVTFARLIRSQELLRSSRLSIGEIAQACGFTEVSYFSARFKKYTGLTPKQWRDRR